MSKLFFRAGGKRFEAGEIVFHTGVQEFASVDGISKGAVELVRSDGASYFADPILCVQGVADVQAFYNQLRGVDIGLARWLLKAWREGATLEECRDRLQRAMAIRETEEA